MSAAAMPYTETVSYSKNVLFVKTNKQDSAYSRDGGKTRINSPKYKNILSEDRCVLSKKFIDYFNELWGSPYLIVDESGVVSTVNKIVLGSLGTEVTKRYIKGSNVIWKVEQEKLNIKPTRDDSIIMIWGELSVDCKAKSTDKGLWIYLLTHNANEDYELRDSSISAPTFKIQDNAKEAKVQLESRQDKIQEAREIVYQVRNRKTNRFDKDKIAFYTNVFRNQISGYDTDEEKFVALLHIADTNPEMIISGVTQENVNYLQTIQEAIGLDILVKENTSFKNTLTNNKVVTFKVGTSEAKAIEKLVDYFASQDGANEFEHLKNSVEAVKVSRHSVVSD